jgi:hypothetical protein
MEAKWTDHAGRIREMQNWYKVLSVYSEGRMPFERLKDKWEDNTKTDLRYRI